MRLPVVLYHGECRFVLGDVEVGDDGVITRSIVNETCGVEFWPSEPHIVVVMKGVDMGIRGIGILKPPGEHEPECNPECSEPLDHQEEGCSEDSVDSGASGKNTASGK